MARAERMLTDEAIATRSRTYNELIPEPGELSGTLFIELTDDAALREWLPKLVGIAAPRALRAGPTGRARVAGRARATRSASPATTSPSTVHYLKFPFDAPSSGPSSRTDPARLADRPSRVPGRGSSSPTTQRAELAGDFAELTPWRSGSSGSTPTCRSRASSTPTTPAYDLHARERVDARSRRRAGARADGPRHRDPVGLRRVRAARARASRCKSRHHRASTRRGSSTRSVPRRAQGVAGEHRPERAVHGRARRPHRAAGDPARRAGRLAGSRASSTPPSATRSASGRRECDVMGTTRKFRFGVQASTGRTRRGVGRAGAQGRRPRLLHAVHARPLRRHRARADGRAVVRGRGHHDACASGCSCSATTTSIPRSSPRKRRRSTCCPTAGSSSASAPAG